MLCYDSFKGPHYVSFFAASFSVRERMDVCLEPSSTWLVSVCPAANAVFSVELWFGKGC